MIFPKMLIVCSQSNEDKDLETKILCKSIPWHSEPLARRTGAETHGNNFPELWNRSGPAFGCQCGVATPELFYRIWNDRGMTSRDDARRPRARTGCGAATPKRERRYRQSGVGCLFSSRHAQFGFPVFASGLIVIVSADGSPAPGFGRRQRGRCPEETTI